MMKLVTGKERDFVFAHDTARIFETLCKYAPVAMRSVLFLTLKDSILEMTRSTYSVFLVKSLLRLGTKQERSLIIGEQTVLLIAVSLLASRCLPEFLFIYSRVQAVMRLCVLCNVT